MQAVRNVNRRKRPKMLSLLQLFRSEEFGGLNRSIAIPAATPFCTSSSVNPPSGPRALMMRFGGSAAVDQATSSGVPPGCANHRRPALGSIDDANSSHRRGGSIVSNRLRPHCLAASVAVRCNRATADSEGCATPRSVISGTKLATPSSTIFSINQRWRSPLGNATASVSSTAIRDRSPMRSKHRNLDAGFADRFDSRLKFIARAIEQRDKIALLGAHDVGQMMRFGAGDCGVLADDWHGNKKPL